MKQFFSKKNDLQKFFDSLTSIKPGRNQYTKMDRYRDFRRVFNSDEGKRVLSQIIGESEGLPIIENEVADTHKMAFRAGKRSVGLWIVQVLNAEPLEDNL